MKANDFLKEDDPLLAGNGLYNRIKPAEDTVDAWAQSLVDFSFNTGRPAESTLYSLQQSYAYDHNMKYVEVDPWIQAVRKKVSDIYIR